jgi:hypothetical protein
MAYTEKQIETIFNDICKQIGEDGKSLRAVLRQDNMPTSQTFYKWVDSNEDKTLQYTRAITEDRPNIIFEDILVIADKQDKDVSINEEGFEVVNHNVHARAKIMIDARKWMLGKMNPKKYSDKNTTIHEGGDKPIQAIISLGNGLKPES